MLEIKNETEAIITLSKKLRKNILDLSFYAGSSSSHFGGALSSVEIVATLFNSVNLTMPLKVFFEISKIL